VLSTLTNSIYITASLITFSGKYFNKSNSERNDPILEKICATIDAV